MIGVAALDGRPSEAGQHRKASHAVFGGGHDHFKKPIVRNHFSKPLGHHRGGWRGIGHGDGACIQLVFVAIDLHGGLKWLLIHQLPSTREDVGHRAKDVFQFTAGFIHHPRFKAKPSQQDHWPVVAHGDIDPSQIAQEQIRAGSLHSCRDTQGNGEGVGCATGNDAQRDITALQGTGNGANGAITARGNDD